MTSLAKLVASVAKVTLQGANDSLIRDLERNSQILDRIRDSFSRILDKHTMLVWSFVEELGMRGIGKVRVSYTWE
jgi:protein SERAC1